MVRLLLLPLAALLIATPAQAADGLRARYSIAVTLDDAFMQSVGAPLVGPLAGAFTIPPITGMLYVGGQRLRMDMTLPLGLGVTTTLYDNAGGTVHVLDHNERVAWHHALPTTGDIPLFNLDQLAVNWAVWERELRSRPGVAVRELGRRTINGVPSSGLRFSGDLSDVLTADELALIPGLPNLRDLRGPYEATVWASQTLDMPVKLTSRWRGMNMVWQVAGIESVDVPELLFALPPGYRVRDMQAD